MPVYQYCKKQQGIAFIADQTISQAFRRATLDRNMTVNTAAMQRALAQLDLDGLVILDFGCGSGNLLRLLRGTRAAAIYAFEVIPDHIDPDILIWAADTGNNTPRLTINPGDFKINPDCANGDFTAYDYDSILARHSGFAIIGNPPYFLYNRVLSLTERADFIGALMITSYGRLGNHAGWDVLRVMDGHDFDPPAWNDQYLVQTGFAGRTRIRRDNQPTPQGHPQPRPHINDRNPLADPGDHYPEMWEQLNRLAPRP